ncbi:MAG: hypothetical protein GX564_12595 [Oligosphaeraceae bacterium]|nr:hypothetical protein [Oligosphaeraceae bacterium]
MKLSATLLVLIPALMLAEPVSLIDLQDTLLARQAHQGGKTTLVQEKFTPHSQFGRGAWQTPKRVHGTHPDSEQILSYVSSSLENDGLRMTTTAAISNFKTATGAEPMVSNELARTIELPPEATGKTLTAQFKYSGRGEAGTYIVFLPGPHPLVRSGSAVIPAGATQATAFLRLGGAGDIKVESAEIALLTSEVPSDQPDVLAYAHGYLDAKFFLPEKTPFPLSFILKRDKSKRYRQVFLLLQLPQGYRLTGCDKTLKIVSNASGLVRLAADKAMASTITDNDFCVWRPPLVLLQSDLAPSEELAVMRYGLEVEGKALPQHELRLGTMAKISAPAPQLFHTGIMQQYGLNLDRPEAEAYTALLAGSGFNALQGGPSEELKEQLTAGKFLHIGGVWSIRDGYPRGKNPPFLGIDGKQFRDQVCPIASAQAGFFDATLRDAMARMDHFSNNWEAYSSDYKGCFCPQCCTAFAQFAAIPEAELKAVWPQEVIRRHHDQWVRFRSRQHAAIIAALEESISRIGRELGRESHFIPMLSRSVCSDALTFGQQYSPVDFLKHLKLVNVWGPYTHSAGRHRLYSYLPGKYLTHYLEVRDVKRFVDKYSEQPVGIIGLPYGCHGTNVNPPEAIALETIDNFLTGYAASLIYWFNFDYRYYTRMTEANRKMALYEEQVRTWPRDNTVRVEAAAPVISPEHIRAWLASSKLCPEIESITSTIQLQAYRQDQRLLAAVGNFWEKSPVFIKLSAPDLSGDYLLLQPHRGQYRRTSGTELSAGIKLYIPALTWEFFLLEPDRGQAVSGTECRATDIEALYAETLPLLRATMDQENADLSRRKHESSIVEYNFAETPEIVSGPVTLKELRREDKQALEVLAPKYRLVLEPEHGGQIASLLCHEQELASTWIGRVGFLKPSSFICDSALQIRQIRALAQGVEVELYRKNISGLDLTVTWTFRPDGFTQRVGVSNATAASFTLIPRFHSMMRFLAPDGTFTVGTDSFRSEPQHRLLLTATDSEKLAPRLGVNTPLALPSGPVEFTAPGQPQKLIFQTEAPLYGIYLWNSPGAENGSFEPIFTPRKLQPGQSTEFEQQLHLP